ncbi:coenzyme F420-0:L-glutamate ligase [Methanobacterium spitsbergense]|uniref:Coenzyme F420-0:L-glutamate ligase n=1 Tax=Methanobacterium spitsbergense TaxID=2874285 RepID=A0A8T5UXX8_9EURY|nr:coenzyme F420-0:L-glutamate ligase [Methanobacterium spitsbergense]MBZ2165569.1 coenzyme F420-0:L-glutamate ligase [Methanobacterium spitsbergense]
MKTDKISTENIYGSELYPQKDQGPKNESKYTLIPVKTDYIKPNESYDMIIKCSADLLNDGDFLVISETPISVSQGRLVDESKFKASFLSFLLADIWSKYIWGYLLGPIFRIKSRTIQNLRKLPPEARVHKRVILEHYGLKHALKPASEAGVDLSNVPGTMVSLLPENPNDVAKDIAKKIMHDLKIDVTVMIIDTDASYQLIGKKFTSLPIAVPGIKSDLGIFGYLLGRFGKILGPTPLGVSRPEKLDTMLKIAKLAEEYHENNEKDIKTVYDMENIFEGDITGITIEMLNSVEHTPAIIVRRLF